MTNNTFQLGIQILGHATQQGSGEKVAGGEKGDCHDEQRRLVLQIRP
jgi:hypothetical protein